MNRFMKNMHIPPTILEFLTDLKLNNNREWFEANKKRFKAEEKSFKQFFAALFDEMKKHDEVDEMKTFRIYRDVRFSADKTPYKGHFSGTFHRLKPRLRGGYYLHIEPGNSFAAGGFWEPSKEDLLRIRKEFEMDDKPMRAILNDPAFNTTFGKIFDSWGDELKSAPAGFSKDHNAADLLRFKHFTFSHKFTDEEVLAPGFLENVNEVNKKLRPFFDYMSEVLTTDLNGVSLLD